MSLCPKYPYLSFPLDQRTTPSALWWPFRLEVLLPEREVQNAFCERSTG